LDIYFHVISDGNTPELDSVDGKTALRNNIETQVRNNSPMPDKLLIFVTD
jgi:hypothetical protein